MTSHDPAPEAADLLWQAWRTGNTMPALPESVRPRDRAAAMAIQRGVTERAGASVGWKVGATSPASQALLGVDGPLLGAVHERFLLSGEEPMSLTGQRMRVAEPEFAFVLASDVDGPTTAQGILAYVGALHLAIEVPDSRYDSFDGVDGRQILADGTCSGSFLLGPRVDGWQNVDVIGQRVVLHVNGEQVSEGSGATVLGDPRASLHWLACELPQYGLSLRAGDVVTTGTAAPPAAVAPGDSVVAEFPGLGSVELGFVE